MNAVRSRMSDHLVLLEKAREAMKNAYCPYSKFPVGAAVLTEDGSIFIGANQENACYAGGICAERSAMVAALSKGHREFQAVAVVSELEDPITPCGICRQFLVEYGDFKVIMGSSKNDNVRFDTTKSLLPFAFAPDTFGEHESRKETEINGINELN